MLTLADALTPVAGQSALHYTAEIPAGWEQGRGAYGGLVLGLLVRAVERFEASSGEPGAAPRPVRAIAGEIAAPVQAGVARIAIAPMRRGNAVAFVRAELWQLEQGAEVCVAHAAVVLAAARPAMPAWCTRVMPEAPAWQHTAVLPVAAPVGPAFAQHFEIRPVLGLPYTQRAPECVGYVRPHRPGNWHSAATVTALADVWWPTAMVTFAGPRPTATITFQLDIVGVLTDLQEPLLHHAISNVAADGYVQETRELWTPDGQLLSVNHQTFVVIK